jgi:hypothetical protein
MHTFAKNRTPVAINVSSLFKDRNTLVPWLKGKIVLKEHQRIIINFGTIANKAFGWEAQREETTGKT